MRLAGKRALVTGVGSGIGRECALMFAEEGARVAGVDINPRGLQHLQKAALERSVTVEALTPCDLTQSDSATAIVDEAARLFGGLDILVNAAAMAVFKPIQEMRDEDWGATLSGELDSVFFVTRAAWPHLSEGGRAIINFASVNAYMALEGSYALAHCAGKGGVLALTRQLAMEGGPSNVRANTISPGLIETDAASRHLEDTPGLRKRVLTKKMIKRLGKPRDVACVATFLASDEASWITASDFAVDGGARAW